MLLAIQRKGALYLAINTRWAYWKNYIKDIYSLAMPENLGHPFCNPLAIL